MTRKKIALLAWILCFMLIVSGFSQDSLITGSSIPDATARQLYYNSLTSLSLNLRTVKLGCPPTM